MKQANSVKIRTGPSLRAASMSYMRTFQPFARYGPQVQHGLAGFCDWQVGNAYVNRVEKDSPFIRR
ncbi:hypothetical protein R5H32_06800 [Defluviimonas sp. D31]|nr:hypothetical protein [Defluviimonas sp. D31]